MATRSSETVVGVFAERNEAQSAIHALKDSGFTDDQIGVATSNRDAEISAHGKDDESYAGEGALTGAATGAGIGALWGLGILAGVVPGIGPAIAGGTLAILLSSAAAGAAAAGLTGALVGMGLTKDEAEYYESEMKAGRVVVAVDAGPRRDEALRLLRLHGGYDISTDTRRSATSPPA